MRMKGIADLFDLPGEIIPVSLIAFGIPAENKTQPEIFRRDRIHRELWVEN